MTRALVKILFVAIALVLVTGLFTIAMAEEDIKVVLDGTELVFDVPPQIINDRTMVPMRKIFESLGAVVNWDEAAKTITATKGETIIIMQIGKAAILVNGEEVILDVAPELANSRTLVPLRAVSESLGATVTWDKAARQVLITSVNVDPANVDIYGLLDYINLLLEYTERPISSMEELKDADLIYFMLALAYDDPRTEAYNEWDSAIKTEVLAEYLFGTFGLSAEYLNKYTSSEYTFLSERNFYDAINDRFVYGGLHMLNSAHYHIDRYSTRVFIDGDKITVKTVLTVQDEYDANKVQDKSADYVFTLFTQNGRTFYRMVSADIYEDDRNAKKDVFLTLDGVNFSAPWFTVYRNGVEEYHKSEPHSKYEHETWDPFYDSKDSISIELAGIKNGKAYIDVIYYGVVDVYIYDFGSKSGYWMSGAKDLKDFYTTELVYMRNNLADLAEARANDQWPPTNGSWYPHYWRNYHIVTISEKHDYALLRRTKTLGEPWGEYVMHNLNTGEETFICDSYTWPGGIISNQEEYVNWVDEDHFQLSVYIDGSPDKRFDPMGNMYFHVDGNYTAPTYYSAIYDGQKWVVNEVDEMIWD